MALSDALSERAIAAISGFGGGAGLGSASEVMAAIARQRDERDAFKSAPTSIGELATIDLGKVTGLSPSASFEDIDALIQSRAPVAQNLIRKGSSEARRLSELGRIEATRPLEQFGDLTAFQEQQALLGTLGDEVQEVAIGSIPVSQFDAELQRRQRQRQLRGAAAAGELGSGATLLGAQQLAGAQQAQSIQNRLAQLEPLVATARGIRSTLSGIDEASRARQAQIEASQGVQLANIGLGAGAQAASSLAQRAELSGLRGISAAQQKAQQQNQLAQLAGQFAPQIGSFVGSFGSQPTATLQTGQTSFIPEAGNIGLA